MTIEQLIRDNPQANNEQIVDLYNANPNGWQMVSSASFLAWLGGNGRYAKLEQVANTVTNDPQMLALKSGVKTVLIAAANPDAELWLAPTAEPRQFLDALVDLQVLSTEDRTALLNRARIYPFATLSQVQTARIRLSRLDQHAQLSNSLASKYSAAQNAINQGLETGVFPTTEQIISFFN